MVAFLGTQGCGDPVTLMSYEDGPTFGMLLALNVEVGRLCLVTEKRQVNAMCVSLASLFDKDVLSKYNAEIQKALEETNILGGDEFSATNGTRQRTRTPPKGSEEKTRQAVHSVQELNKLNILLMGGG